MKRLLFAVLIAGLFSGGNFGCSDQPPKNEIKVTTPGGTTVIIEKPFDSARRIPPRESR